MSNTVKLGMVRKAFEPCRYIAQQIAETGVFKLNGRIFESVNAFQEWEARQYSTGKRLNPLGVASSSSPNGREAYGEVGLNNNRKTRQNRRYAKQKSHKALRRQQKAEIDFAFEHDFADSVGNQVQVTKLNLILADRIHNVESMLLDMCYPGEYSCYFSRSFVIQAKLECRDIARRIAELTGVYIPVTFKLCGEKAPTMRVLIRQYLRRIENRLLS